MTSSIDIARYFISRAYREYTEVDITNLKIQTLLYYSQSIHLVLYGEPLFEDEIQAWRYGPVCPPAYYFYSEFEAQQLPVPSSSDLTIIPEEVIEILEEVWQHFGHYYTYELSKKTHQEFPWLKARKELPPEAASTNPILLDDLKLLGQEKLDEIERSHPCYEPLMAKLIQDALSSDPESQTILNKGEVRGWLESVLN
ncbi:MAG: DUF4065 domain-containing protein [Symploca sp. SIO2B6]|nr:DUF4065 domain-containing protein [Symploca sp. SIO2B6]